MNLRYMGVMREAQQGRQVLERLWSHCKPLLIAGHKLVVTAAPEKRSDPQNRKFHAICRDIARSGHPWMNKPRTAIEWKVLLVSGHSTATKQGAEMVPGLEGEFVNLRESTATMSKARGASLIDYSLSWCAMNGIAVREEQQEKVTA